MGKEPRFCGQAMGKCAYAEGPAARGRQLSSASRLFLCQSKGRLPRGDDGKILDTLSRREATDLGKLSSWQHMAAGSALVTLCQVVAVQEVDAWSPHSLLDFIAKATSSDGRPASFRFFVAITSRT